MAVWPCSFPGMPSLVREPRRRSAPSETLALLGRAGDAGAFGPAPLGAAVVAAVAATPLVLIGPPVRMLTGGPTRRS